MTVALDPSTLQRACAMTDRILGGVDRELRSGPTPCSEWTVLDVMEHIVGLTDFFADVAELGASPDDREWPDYDPDDLAPSFRRLADRLLAAFDMEAMGRPMRLPTGQTTGNIVIQVVIGELFVHSWDLAMATGRAHGNDDIAATLLTSDWMALCDQVRGDPAPPFAPQVAADVAAPATDRLVSFPGRDPHWR
jgi:uncharacterized protein (TIGR03086 family)